MQESNIYYTLLWNCSMSKIRCIFSWHFLELCKSKQNNLINNLVVGSLFEDRNYHAWQINVIFFLEYNFCNWIIECWYVKGCIISQCVFVAIWTVINEGNNRVHLHNDFNYLAIISGQTQVMYFVSSEWTSISRAPCQFSQIFIIENICFQYSFIKTFSWISRKNIFHLRLWLFLSVFRDSWKPSWYIICSLAYVIIEPISND